MLEVISIHIPKTAGTSFLEICNKNYNKGEVYHYIERKNRLRKVKKQVSIYTMPSKTKVLHGHLTYKHLRLIHKWNNSKVITWLRDPVERAISWYLFQQRTIHNNPETNPYKEYKGMPIIDFLSMEEYRNVMSKFLQGIELEDLFFFGFIESFHNDLKQLANMMKWQKINLTHENSNEAFKKAHYHSITKTEREKIKDLNEEDVLLYEKALLLKSLSSEDDNSLRF
ncbi:MAG: sulfotransferase family 2 domain-containing protein [Bacteroidota bacterium]